MHTMFLKKLYSQWRSMFYFLLVLIACQVFFMYKGVETIPFFLFHMYSTRQPALDTTIQTKIFIRGKEFDTRKLTGREKETLMGSLSYFYRLRENNFHATDSATIASRLKGILNPGMYDKVYSRLTNSKIDDKVFFDWWQKYLSRVSGQTADTFSILKSTIIWQPSYRALNDTVSLFEYGK